MADFSSLKYRLFGVTFPNHPVLRCPLWLASQSLFYFLAISILTAFHLGIVCLYDSSALGHLVYHYIPSAEERASHVVSAQITIMG